MSLLRTFLRDRLHWVAMAYINTLLVLLVGSLLLQIRGAAPWLFAREAGYLLLLTTFVLALFLAYDLVRWWPFAARQARLMRTAAEAGALLQLPAGGTADQRASAALLQKVHGLLAAERDRFEAGHRRQLSFIHLWVHQMKTPVSLISLSAQREAENGSDQVRSAMAAMEEQAGKISEGLDLVLHTARLQEFAVDYQVRRVDVAQVVRKVVNGRRRQFIRQELFPHLSVEAADCTVLSDAKWLAFAVDQVVGNALKYGAQAGREGQSLTIRLCGGERCLELSIADTGPGIPPQDLLRVFEPFFTGENGRKYAGATGVGLYLVRRVMDELGHDVSIQSTPGAGTTVTFRFVTEV